jgi:hypothetical protein
MPIETKSQLMLPQDLVDFCMLVDGQGGIYVNQLLQILGFHCVCIAWLGSLWTLYGRGVNLFPS